MSDRPLIAFTIGDPNGIGPEIILKALSKKEIQEICQAVIIGPLTFLMDQLQKLNISLNLTRISDFIQIDRPGHNVTVLDMELEQEFKPDTGQVTVSGGKIAGQSLKDALNLALERKVEAIVTAPISKQAFNLAGYHFPGQTEFFAVKTKIADVVMVLLSGNFRVGLVTTHCAIKSISYLLNKEKILSKLRILNNDLQNRFNIPEPQIAVTALNPHAGEAGMFGNEELDIILPAIKAARKIGIDAAGPFSADTLFARTNENNVDAYLAMYHDQGLIPLKMQSFGKAVNYTAGLPIIRTSPDHGTAYDIAGRGIADSGSIEEAIKLAVQLASNS